MDAEKLKQAAEIAKGLSETHAGRDNLARYFNGEVKGAEGQKAYPTGRIEVIVPAAKDRPPHEPQTIDAVVLTSEEGQQLIDFLYDLYDKRIAMLTAQAEAL